MDDDPRRCTARAKSTGNRCKLPAIPGGRVCRRHGGGAPQVKAKAERRLLAMVEPALVRLEKLLKSREETVAIRAVKDILDRTGFKPSEKIELGGELDIDPGRDKLSDHELEQLLDLLKDRQARED